MSRRQIIYHNAQPVVEQVKPQMQIKDAFKDDEIICLICGKGGMKTLARHLNFIHNLKPGQYRKMFGLKSDWLLTSRKYAESRRAFVQEKQSPEVIAKARAARMAKRSANTDSPASAAAAPQHEPKRAYRRRHIFVPNEEPARGGGAGTVYNGMPAVSDADISMAMMTD
jgi:hypothetical protein